MKLGQISKWMTKPRGEITTQVAGPDLVARKSQDETGIRRSVKGGRCDGV